MCFAHMPTDFMKEICECGIGLDTIDIDKSGLIVIRNVTVNRSRMKKNLHHVAVIWLRKEISVTEMT